MMNTITTTTTTTLPNAATPFRILFGRNPCTILDALMPETDKGTDMGGINTFVEDQRRPLKEVIAILAGRHHQQEAARFKRNQKILRPSAGSAADEGSLVFVRELDSSRLGPENRASKLVHEKRTGPWRVDKVIRPGLEV